MDRGAYLPRFEGIWDEKNGKRAPWKSNPWCWRIELEDISRAEAFEAEKRRAA